MNESYRPPSTPEFETYGPDGPDGESWHEYFKALRTAKADAIEAEIPSDEITILETGLEVEELTSTQKAVVEEARKTGFDLRIYGARAHHTAVIQKKDGKTASAGEETSPEVEVFNVFIEGRFPKSVLAFRAAWVGRTHKFNGAVSDPIGRYVDVPGILACDRLREVQWTIEGSKEFQAWIDQWRGALTGITKAMEKSTKVEETAMRKSLAAMKKEMIDAG